MRRELLIAVAAAGPAQITIGDMATGIIVGLELDASAADRGEGVLPLARPDLGGQRPDGRPLGASYGGGREHTHV